MSHLDGGGLESREEGQDTGTGQGWAGGLRAWAGPWRPPLPMLSGGERFTEDLRRRVERVDFPRFAGFLVLEMGNWDAEWGQGCQLCKHPH